MTDLIVPNRLADRLLSIAEQEKRPVEAVLESMLDRYVVKPSDDEVDAQLMAMGIFTPPSDEAIEPPMTIEETQALAARIGAAGSSLSEISLEERRESY